MNRVRVMLAAGLVVTLVASGCATPAEKADQSLIRGRRDPGAEAAGVRVAGPGGATAKPVGGKAVEGRWARALVTVAQAGAPAQGGVSAQAGATSPLPAGLPQDGPSGSREGLIVAVRGETVYVDLGRDDGAAVGQRLRVVRPGAPLVHPVTGQSLGAVDDEVALLEVTAVSEKFATTKVVRLAGGASLEPRDRVLSASPAAAAAPAQPRAEAPAPAAGTAPAGYLLDTTRSVTSQELPFELRDLAIADLDGDGHVEVVALGQYRLVIYRWTGRALELRFEEEEEVRRDYVSVEAADLDGDGKAELLVNDAFDKRVTAAILTLNGRQFVRHELPRDRYFRIVGAEIGQPTLVGQRRGNGETPFVGDVHKYEWKNGKARQREAIWLPVRTGIFDFQYYRTPEGSVELAVLGASGTLRLYRGREEAWASQQEFDGTKLRVVEQNPKPPQSTAGQEEMVTPIPGRIVPIPTARGRSGDPVPAFALRQNEKSSVISPRFSFARGRVVAIAVESAVTRELWRTDTFEGYVAAFRMADLGAVPAPGGIGGRALVVGLDMQRGVLKAARSVLVVQPLR